MRGRVGPSRVVSAERKKAAFDVEQVEQSADNRCVMANCESLNCFSTGLVSFF